MLNCLTVTRVQETDELLLSSYRILFIEDKNGQSQVLTLYYNLLLAADSNKGRNYIRPKIKFLNKIREKEDGELKPIH